jgi:hypothetical protein
MCYTNSKAGGNISFNMATPDVVQKCLLSHLRVLYPCPYQLGGSLQICVFYVAEMKHDSTATVFCCYFNSLLQPVQAQEGPGPVR